MGEEIMKIEQVKWKDAVSIDEWTETEAVSQELHEIISVGINIGETDEVLTLALNFDNISHLSSCIMNIPKSLIVKRKTVTLRI
jgi:hypothetical protein